MIAVGVLPAILEELLFRGALLEGLRIDRIAVSRVSEGEGQ